jgi:type I restriction enzyme S subunit
MKKGWQTKKLREVCELVNGRAYSKPELLAAGKYRVLRVGNFFTNNHWYHSDMELEEKKYCDTGDLLYAWSASFGPRMWTGGKVIYHYHIWKVVHDCSQIDQKFLFYFFQWDTEKIKEDQGTGTTMMHVSMGSMNERDIHLPPLAEQQRIVGLLDEAFEGLATANANAEKNLQNARALFESHLQSVFTKRGEGWVDTALGGVCGFVRGPFGGSLKKSIFVADGYAVYEQQHAIYDQFDDVRYFIDEVKFKEMRRFELLPDDLIMSCSGTMGRVAIVPKDIKRGIINQALLKLTPSSKILNTFLKSWMESEAFQDALKEYSGGAAIQNVASVKILKEIKVPLPSMSDQKRVVEELDDLHEETQRLARLYERKLAELEALKKSLLHQAFAGSFDVF